MTNKLTKDLTNRMNNLIKKITIFILLASCYGCSSNGPRLLTYINYHHSQSAEEKVSLNLRFGPHWNSTTSSLGFRGSPKSTPPNGSITGEEIVAWWKVEDLVFPEKSKYYYARSLPEMGVVGPEKPNSSSSSYEAYVSFGRIERFEYALTKEQLKESTFLRKTPGGDNKYLWGANSNFYYFLSGESIKIETQPVNWIVLKSIEISKDQFETLDSRCEAPWYEVKCFIDPDFKGLSNAQLSYVNERAHKLDADRMAGKVETKTKPTENIWK